MPLGTMIVFGSDKLLLATLDVVRAAGRLAATRIREGDWLRPAARGVDESETDSSACGTKGENPRRPVPDGPF